MSLMKSSVCFFDSRASLLCDQKITTGNATNDSWNISRSQKVQKTLALIISDCIEAESNLPAKFRSKIPNYIRTLYDQYRLKTIKPRFDGIDQIQHGMAVELQEHIFVDAVDMAKRKLAISMELSMALDLEAMGLANTESLNVEQQISHEKVLLLFPNAQMYINDQLQQINVIEP